MLTRQPAIAVRNHGRVSVEAIVKKPTSEDKLEDLGLPKILLRSLLSHGRILHQFQRARGYIIIETM